jgi:tryptophanyl-tRNA synthetase
LQRGAERARAIARPLLARLREAVGLRRSRLLSTPSTPAPKNEAPPLVKQYREADGLFYVKLTQGDEVLLLSPGFAQGRDAGQWWSAIKAGQAPEAAAVQSAAWPAGLQQLLAQEAAKAAQKAAAKASP